MKICTCVNIRKYIFFLLIKEIILPLEMFWRAIKLPLGL